MNFYFLGGIMGLTILLGVMVNSSLLIIMLMELALFTFIFMMSEYSTMAFSRSCIKYFFPQSLGSLILFVGSLFLLNSIELSSAYHSVFLMGVSLKLGVFPLFYWVVPMNLELPYTMLWVVGSPLKVLPLALYSNYFGMFSVPVWANVMNVLGLASMLTGVWLGLYLKTLRGILGASSITHTGWFILGVHSACIMKYFALYTLSFYLVLYLATKSSYFLSALALLGLGGLPPFGVFVGKLIVVYSSLSCNMSMLYLVLALVVSAFSLFYYLKFGYSMYMYNVNCASRWLPSYLGFALNLGASFFFCFYFFYGRDSAVDF